MTSQIQMRLTLRLLKHINRKVSIIDDDLRPHELCFDFTEDDLRPYDFRFIASVPLYRMGERPLQNACSIAILALAQQLVQSWMQWRYHHNKQNNIKQIKNKQTNYGAFRGEVRRMGSIEHLLDDWRDGEWGRDRESQCYFRSKPGRWGYFHF